MEPQQCVLNRVLTKCAVSCNCMSRRVDDNPYAREFEPCLATGPCAVSRNLGHRVQVRKAMQTQRKQQRLHLHTQRPSLCTATAPPGASALRGSASCCVNTSQNWEASPTHLIHIQGVAYIFLADAAVSTPVYAPPLMPIHDTRLKFGGVMRFRTKHISQRLLHRAP